MCFSEDRLSTLVLGFLKGSETVWIWCCYKCKAQ